MCFLWRIYLFIAVEACSKKTEVSNFPATTYAAKKTVLVDSSNLPLHHHVSREPEHAIPHVRNHGISGGRGRGVSNLPAWMTREKKVQEIKVPSATKNRTSEQATLQGIGENTGTGELSLADIFVWHWQGYYG